MRKVLLQPILVRPNPRVTPRYEIVAGERRWRAAQRAPLHDVPVIVRSFTDSEALEVAIIENVQRVNLNPVEEAESYARLVEHFGYTQEQLAETVSKSRSHIANTLRLLKLDDPVRDLLRDGRLSAGHARALIGRADAPLLAAEIVRDGLSVRDIEKRVAKPGTGARTATKSGGRKSAPVAKDSDTRALEADLSATTGAQVEIDHTASGRGTVTIRYGSLEALDLICERLGRTHLP